jgi:hypothetical protein
MDLQFLMDQASPGHDWVGWVFVDEMLTGKGKLKEMGRNKVDPDT